MESASLGNGSQSVALAYAAQCTHRHTNPDPCPEGLIVHTQIHRITPDHRSPTPEELDIRTAPMSVLTQHMSPIDLCPRNDLVLEEALDALDPLRHFFNFSDETHKIVDQTEAFIPLQPSSAVKEIIQLSFGVKSTSTHYLPFEPISISLAVDASPGCGGVAWPAGQVYIYSSEGSF
jgi:hypothetical protein